MLDCLTIGEDNEEKTYRRTNSEDTIRSSIPWQC